MLMQFMKTTHSPKHTATGEPQISLGDAFNEELSTVACYAAVEIDRLRHGLDSNLVYVSVLAHRMVNLLGTARQNSMEFLSNPPAAIAVSRAINDSSWSPDKKHTAGDLIRYGSMIQEELMELCENPEIAKDAAASNYKKLRNFCLALSDRISASKKPLESCNPLF